MFKGSKMESCENRFGGVYADKVRDDSITKCCDVFRGIVRRNKLFLYAQLIVYLLLGYEVLMAMLSVRYLVQGGVCLIFTLAALAVTVVKRDMKGDLVGLGIDVAAIAVFMYFRLVDSATMILFLASMIIHGIRAEKIYCYDRIKDLYGFSRFNSFDICNQVLGDDDFADSIIASYENAFDNELMKYERASHYVPPLFKKIQTLSACAVVAGIAALVVSSVVTAKVNGAQKIDKIGAKTGGAVKGTVTQILDVKSYSTDSLTDEEYWVTFGGEQVCFSVPSEHKEKFESLLKYQHPEKFDADMSSDVKPSSKPIEFTGEIVKADDSKYADSRLDPSKQAKENSDLEFNTRYYIKLYSTAFYNTLQKIGIALIIIGAVAWAATILLGSLEKRRY